MDVMMIWIPSSLLFAALLIWFLVWGVKNGQYDDVEGEKYRILYDDDPN